MMICFVFTILTTTMALTDTTEYWWGIKEWWVNPITYYHVPVYNCSHRHHKHHQKAKHISQVNCKECLAKYEKGVPLPSNIKEFGTKGESRCTVTTDIMINEVDGSLDAPYTFSGQFHYVCDTGKIYKGATKYSPNFIGWGKYDFKGKRLKLQKIKRVKNI